MTLTPRGLFRVAAIAETITWAMLILGLVLKYGAGLDLAVTVSGGIHGFVFLAYAAAALLVGINQRWDLGHICIAVATAVVPFATIPVERWFERTGRLDGRWMLRHPGRLIAIGALAVAAAFVVLLLAGPPGR